MRRMRSFEEMLGTDWQDRAFQHSCKTYAVFPFEHPKPNIYREHDLYYEEHPHYVARLRRSPINPSKATFTLQSCSRLCVSSIVLLITSNRSRHQLRLQAKRSVRDSS